MLINRLLAILDLRYEPSANIRKILDKFVGNPNKSHFVVLNWDIVLENHLHDYLPGTSIDYCVDISPWDGPDYLQEPSETDKRAVRDDPDLKAPYYEGELVISAARIYFVTPFGSVIDLGETERILSQT